MSFARYLELAVIGIALLPLLLAQSPAEAPPITARGQVVRLLAFQAYTLGACEHNSSVSLKPTYPEQMGPKLKEMLLDAYRQGKEAPRSPNATPARCAEALAGAQRQLRELTRQPLNPGS